MFYNLTHHWLFFSIIATVSLGISMAFYKMPAMKKYSPILSTFWTNLFSAIFIFAILAATQITTISQFSTISWYGLGWGIFFGINMILTKILLESGDVGSVLPVTSSLGNIIVIVIGITLLSESVSLIQAAGIVLILISVFFFSKKDKAFPKVTWRIFLLAFGVIATSTVSKYIQKLGAVHDTMPHFMMYQYLGAAVTALVFLLFWERSSFKTLHTEWKTYFRGAMLIAVFSVIGGWAILTALSLGPLSGVYAIHPAYTFVTALAGYYFFKEKLTRSKILLVLLTIAGVILIKIGG